MYNAAQIYRYIFPKIKIEDSSNKNEAKQIRNLNNYNNRISFKTLMFDVKIVKLI